MSELGRIVAEAQQKVDQLSLEAHYALTGAPSRSASPRGSQDLAGCIEHTNLKPDATPDDIRRLCAEARTHGFFGVCVNPAYVHLAKTELAGSDCKVVTVIGFPLGASHSQTKAAEVHRATDADEFDMVLPIGLLIGESYRAVFEDVREVVAAAADRPVKVILETGLLTPKQAAIGCLLAARAGAQFVKTSTGFGPRGAVVEDVWLMKECVGTYLRIKAAGGISDYRTARILVEAGADRLGSSNSVNLIRGVTTIGPPAPADLEHLKVAAEHGASLFIYHAGQRLASVRLFFAVLPILIAGFVTLLGSTSDVVKSNLRPLAVISSLLGTAIILGLWGLDERNHQLVEADERLVRRAEAGFAALTGLQEFHTIRFTDHAKPQWLRYSWIMRLLFAIGVVLGSASAWWAYKTL